jgi:hypothetical protein
MSNAELLKLYQVLFVLNLFLVDMNNFCVPHYGRINETGITLTCMGYGVLPDQIRKAFLAARTKFINIIRGRP